MLDRIDKAVDFLARATMFMAAFIVLSMTLMISAYIFVREVLNGHWIFVEEWVGYLLVFVAYWGCAYTLRSDGHINVDVVFRLLPRRGRLWLGAFTSLVALLILGFFLDLSIRHVVYAVQESWVSSFPSLSPMWLPISFIPIGLSIFILVMALRLVQRVIVALRGTVEEAAVTSQHTQEVNT